MTLLESFLRSRGNLRDIERELGISYPTVRARVDSLVRALGFGEPVGASGDDEVGEDHPDITDEGQAAARQDILERLARHEIGAEEAAAAIRASAKGKA
jgi:hypothetical protein